VSEWMRERERMDLNMSTCDGMCANHLPLLTIFTGICLLLLLCHVNEIRRKWKIYCQKLFTQNHSLLGFKIITTKFNLFNCHKFSICAQNFTPKFPLMWHFGRRHCVIDWSLINVSGLVLLVCVYVCGWLHISQWY
jgi:hypothetical protein